VFEEILVGSIDPYLPFGQTKGSGTNMHSTISNQVLIEFVIVLSI
jgi:hypothetical protein